MDTNSILKAIDAEIKSLQEARALLSLEGRPARGTRGRRAAAPVEKAAGKKRTLSPEARKRIAEAQKRRWANAHAAAKKTPGRKPAGANNALLPKSMLLSQSKTRAKA
jgi:hypothetical protein